MSVIWTGNFIESDARLEGTLKDRVDIALDEIEELIRLGLRMYGRVRVTVEREDIEIIKDGEGSARVSGLPDEGEVSR